MELAATVRPIWRVVQVVRISKGVDDGLRTFILAPFLYDIFAKLSSTDDALFYTSLVWAIYFGLIAFLEVPTGALADIIGRARVTILSLMLNVLYALGLTALIFVSSLPLAVVIGVAACMMRALTYTLFGGAFAAWTVDSINEVHPEFGHERILARGYAYYHWAMIIGSVIGVALYLHGVPVVAFIIGALISLCCATYCMAEMTEPSSLYFIKFRHFLETASSRMQTTIREGIRTCERMPILWWLLGIQAAYDFLLNVITFLWPVTMSANFGTARWSPEWYGMAFGVPCATAISAKLLAWYGDRRQQQAGAKMSNPALRRWLIGNFFMAAVSIIALGIINHSHSMHFFLFAVCILIAQSTFGSTSPCVTTLISNYMPNQNAQERATILSISSMLRGVFMLVLLIPSNGATGASSPTGWMIPASIVFIAAIIGNWRLRREERPVPIVPATSAVQHQEGSI